MKWRMGSEAFYSIEYKNESGSYIEHCALFRTYEEAEEFASAMISPLKWYIITRMVWVKA